MSASKYFVSAALLAALLSSAAPNQAQSLIRGPILGFVPDNSGAALRPLLGIPGASKLGDPVDTGIHIRNTAVSPRQDYALAISADDDQPVIVALVDDASVILPIANARPGGDSLVISPSGTAAAVYHADSGVIQVIGRLPRTREVIREFDTSALGRGTSVIISDDGNFAMFRTVDGENAGLWIIDQDHGARRVLLDNPAAAAFFPNQPGTTVDAVVTDAATHSAFLIADVGGEALYIPLASVDSGSFSSVTTSPDSRRVFLADAETGTVGIVDIRTHIPTWLSCDCRPTGFSALKGNSIYRLNDPLGAPMNVLDASSEEARILIVPSKPLSGPEPR